MKDVAFNQLSSHPPELTGMPFVNQVVKAPDLAAINVSIDNQLINADWDAFTEGLSEGRHVQTSLWAKLKIDAGWQSRRILVTQNGQILAGTQILSKQLAPGFRLGYISKGPLFKQQSPQLIDILLKAIKEEMKSLGLMALIVQPPSFEEGLLTALTNQGYGQSGMHMMPTATVLLNCQEEDPITKRPKRVRNLMRRAIKKGITLREGTKEDIETFYQLYMTVSNKKDFHPASLEQFKLEWDLLQPAGYLRLFMAEFEGEAVAANWIVSFGDTLKATRYGWSGEHKDKSPIEGMDYLTMLWAKENGYSFYDLDGVDPKAAAIVSKGEPLPESYHNSATFFKLKYNGDIAFYPEPLILFRFGAFNWVYQRVLRPVANHPFFHKIFNRLRVS